MTVCTAEYMPGGTWSAVDDTVIADDVPAETDGSLIPAVERPPATVTPAAAAAPKETTARNQRVAGRLNRAVGMNAASTSARLLFAAARPVISGDC